MDGNNSLKLVDSTFRSGSVCTDNRVSNSKRWISPENVDIFKDEVNKKVGCQSPPQSISDFLAVQPESRTAPSVPLPAPSSGAMPIPAVTPVNAASADPVPDTTDDALPDTDLDGEDVAWLNLTEIDELTQCVNTCVERWQNAGPEAHKKKFALFAVAGVFLAVCRHGHVLAICNMIRSGEL